MATKVFFELFSVISVNVNEERKEVVVASNKIHSVLLSGLPLPLKSPVRHSGLQSLFSP